MQPMHTTTEAWVLVSGHAQKREGRIAERAAGAYGHGDLTLGALWSACLPAWRGGRAPYQVTDTAKSIDVQRELGKQRKQKKHSEKISESIPESSAEFMAGIAFSGLLLKCLQQSRDGVLTGLPFMSDQGHSA